MVDETSTTHLPHDDPQCPWCPTPHLAPRAGSSSPPPRSRASEPSTAIRSGGRSLHPPEGPPIDRPPPRTHKELVEERERAAGLPPRREQYGEGAAGDAAFQGDRAKWYEAFTGEPLAGSLAEQNEKFDVVARLFREYNDGRVTRRERMED